jgi:hypothetical protein
MMKLLTCILATTEAKKQILMIAQMQRSRSLGTIILACVRSLALVHFQFKDRQGLRNKQNLFRFLKQEKGTLARYLYYGDPNDATHFYVLIQGNIHAKAEKIDLGSMHNKFSIIYKVWSTIDEKLKKPTFRKADLNVLIPDHRIVENRQPVKAMIDVLEHLGYIRKTGNRRGRSEEYEKTGKAPPVSKLDEYV